MGRLQVFLLLGLSVATISCTNEAKKSSGLSLKPDSPTAEIKTVDIDAELKSTMNADSTLIISQTEVDQLKGAVSLSDEEIKTLKSISK